MPIDPHTKQQVLLTPEWERLITLAKRVEFGELTITVKHGKPVMVEQVAKRVKLDDESQFNEGMMTIAI